MADPSNYISILQITDAHIMATPEATLLGVNTAHYFNAVLEHAVNSGKQFDLCLATGDLAQDACPASYQYIKNALQKYNVPCICLPGNHDDFDLMQRVLCTEQINCRKQVILGNWQIVCLNSQIPDSADGYLAAAELSFLEQCLLDNPALFTLIAIHHNCLPCGSDWMDTMMIENAQALFDLVKRHANVKAIINGHVHQAADIQWDTVRVLSTPSTCFQFKPDSANFSLDDSSPGYRWLNLFENGTIQTAIVRIPETVTGLQPDPEGY